MTKLRFLNYFLICCFFTPFFQLCTGCDGGEPPATEETAAIEEPKTTSDSTYKTLKKDTSSTIKEATTRETPPSTNRYIEYIADLLSPLIVTNNFTLSGAGMIYVFIACTIESSIPPIHPVFILTIVSLSFLSLMTFKIHKRKEKLAIRYSSFLVISNLLLFITAILSLDNFADIRWGFYLFLLSSFLIMILLRVKPSEFPNE